MEYNNLLTEYNKVILDYKRGLLTKEECIQKTELLEDKMIEIEVKSGI